MSLSKLLEMADNLQNDKYRSFIYQYFEIAVPTYFFEIGASSSGKYHPSFAQGKGGLVRHTVAVCMILEELLAMKPYCDMSNNDKDLARIACLCHDTCKYGVLAEMDRNCYPDHAVTASNLVAEYWEAYFNRRAPRKLIHAIASHMGQWEESKNKPRNRLDKVVHLADYIASRNFIEIKELK